MAIEPAAISAKPAVTTSVEACGLVAMAPEIPAARAKGTVRPSDIPITTSRTDSGAVKWCSVWGVAGIQVSPAIKSSFNGDNSPKIVELGECNMPSLSTGYAFTIQFDPELKIVMRLGGRGFRVCVRT